MAKTRLIGKIVSDKMDKTVLVEVERLKRHPRYLRRIRVHKKYKAHDPNNEYRVGDKVVLEASRPLSKEKRWIVVQKI